MPLGGARPSLFQVIVPQDISGSLNLNVTTLAQIPFVCRAASLPPMRINDIEVPYMGRNIKVAGFQTFEDWNITIMNDNDFAIRELFESWGNSINSLESNIRQPTLIAENYKLDLQVNQFGLDGTIIRSYMIIGAWPKVISPIELDFEAANQIEVFQVSFACDYWIPSEGTAAVTINSYLNQAITPASV